jgi:hypothetical protein
MYNMLNLKSSQTQYLQTFVYEIKINIFKYVAHPLNLALTCQDWSIIVKDPYVKIEWLIVNYGKAHALLQAIRLGPTFIDKALCQVLIERKVITSKSITQILLKYFGNQKLNIIRIDYNFDQFGSDKIHSFQQKIKSNYLSNGRYSQSAINNKRDLLHSKGKEMQLFHILTASYRVNYTPVWMLSKKELKYIEDLIINPHRSKSLQLHNNGAKRFFEERFSRYDVNKYLLLVFYFRSNQKNNLNI